MNKYLLSLNEFISKNYEKTKIALIEHNNYFLYVLFVCLIFLIIFSYYILEGIIFLIIMYILFAIALYQYKNILIEWNEENICFNKIYRLYNNKKIIKTEIIKDVVEVQLETSKLINVYKFTKKYTILNHFKNIINKFNQTKSVTICNKYADYLSDKNREYLENQFLSIKYFTWLIPTVGFMGTVHGISRGIGKFKEIFDTGKDLDIAGEIAKQILNNVISDFGSAFHTTFVALILGAILTGLISRRERKEEKFLLDIDHFVSHEFIIIFIQYEKNDAIELNKNIFNMLNDINLNISKLFQLYETKSSEIIDTIELNKNNYNMLNDINHNISKLFQLYETKSSEIYETNQDVILIKKILFSILKGLGINKITPSYNKEFYKEIRDIFKKLFTHTVNQRYISSDPNINELQNSTETIKNELFYLKELIEDMDIVKNFQSINNNLKNINKLQDIEEEIKKITNITNKIASQITDIIYKEQSRKTENFINKLANKNKITQLNLIDKLEERIRNSNKDNIKEINKNLIIPSITKLNNELTKLKGVFEKINVDNISQIIDEVVKDQLIKFNNEYSMNTKDHIRSFLDNNKHMHLDLLKNIEDQLTDNKYDIKKITEYFITPTLNRLNNKVEDLNNSIRELFITINDEKNRKEELHEKIQNIGKQIKTISDVNKEYFKEIAENFITNPINELTGTIQSIDFENMIEEKVDTKLKKNVALILDNFIK